MTTTTQTATSGADVRRERANPLGPVRDALAIAGRNLIALRRVPRLLVFSTIQPVVFLLLFRYVFGGVVSTSLIGVPYVDYLLAGRTLADLARNVFVVALMVVIGVGVGFRVHTGPLPFLGGMLLVLLFAY